MSPSDLLPAPPASPQTENVELSVLLDTLLLATEQADRWADHRRALLDALSTFHELGKVEDKFDHAGWSIQYSAGRRAYDYPPSVTELEAKLQEAKEAAVVAHTAIQRPAKPFWIVRRPKATQEAA
jgi:hypothetical protein